MKNNLGVKETCDVFPHYYETTKYVGDIESRKGADGIDYHFCSDFISPTKMRIIMKNQDLIGTYRWFLSGSMSCKDLFAKEDMNLAQLYSVASRNFPLANPNFLNYELQRDLEYNAIHNLKKTSIVSKRPINGVKTQAVAMGPLNDQYDEFMVDSIANGVASGSARTVANIQNAIVATHRIYGKDGLKRLRDFNLGIVATDDYQIFMTSGNSFYREIAYPMPQIPFTQRVLDAVSPQSPFNVIESSTIKTLMFAYPSLIYRETNGSYEMLKEIELLNLAKHMVSKRTVWKESKAELSALGDNVSFFDDYFIKNFVKAEVEAGRVKMKDLADRCARNK